MYASALTLNHSGIANTICDLEISNNINVSKNALIKKRNNDITFGFIKKINDELIKMIYDSKNKFITPYNLKMDRNKTSYTKNFGNINKTLFINRTNKRFVGSDGMQNNLNKTLINGNDIKKSANGNYGICIICTLYNVINNIPIKL